MVQLICFQLAALILITGWNCKSEYLKVGGAVVGIVTAVVAAYLGAQPLS